MLFSKEDLQLGHYSWNQTDQGIFNGTPSRRLFDRFNGNQVLFLINLFASTLEKFGVEDGRQVELRLFNELPIDQKSEVSVYNWLKA
jgi:hypothetical protein